MTVGTGPLASIIVLASFKANDLLAARAIETHELALLAPASSPRLVSRTT